MTDERHAVVAEDGLAAGGSARLRAAALVWLLLAGAQIALAFSQGGSSDRDDDPVIYQWSLGTTSLVFTVLLTAITLGIASLDPAGWRRAAGVVGFRASALKPAFATVVAALVVGGILEPFLHAGEEQGLAPQEFDSARLGPLLFNAIVICTAVPLTEELFFRGVGVRVLGIVGVVPAIAATGLFFGLAHGLLVALPPLVLFGIGLAWVRSRSGSVWPGVIAHGGYNALGIALSLLL